VVLADESAGAQHARDHDVVPPAAARRGDVLGVERLGDLVDAQAAQREAAGALHDLDAVLAHGHRPGGRVPGEPVWEVAQAGEAAELRELPLAHGAARRRPRRRMGRARVLSVCHICVTNVRVSQNLSIRLEDDLVAALDEEARRSGVSRNRIVRDAIVRSLVRKDLGRFREAVGLMRGPRDLSTNRAYRRAWKRPPA
jgi:ribbon-helix-helix CopG family protein